MTNPTPGWSVTPSQVFKLTDQDLEDLERERRRERALRVRIELRQEIEESVQRRVPIRRIKGE